MKSVLCFTFQDRFQNPKNEKEKLCIFKETSVGPGHCVWSPDFPFELSCYLALDRPTGIHIVKGRQMLIF